MPCIEITIRGRVQGVGFRQFAAERARRHELAGWVRNEADGSLCVVACGSETSLKKLKNELQDGPALARVDSLQTRPTDFEPEAQSLSFRIVT
jgi:acylphosphatase